MCPDITLIWFGGIPGCVLKKRPSCFPGEAQSEHQQNPSLDWESMEGNGAGGEACRPEPRPPGGEKARSLCLLLRRGEPLLSGRKRVAQPNRPRRASLAPKGRRSEKAVLEGRPAGPGRRWLRGSQAKQAQEPVPAGRPVLLQPWPWAACHALRPVGSRRPLLRKAVFVPLPQGHVAAAPARWAGLGPELGSARRALPWLPPSCRLGWCAEAPFLCPGRARAALDALGTCGEPDAQGRPTQEATGNRCLRQQRGREVLPWPGWQCGGGEGGGLQLLHQVPGVGGVALGLPPRPACGSAQNPTSRARGRGPVLPTLSPASSLRSPEAGAGGALREPVSAHQFHSPVRSGWTPGSGGQKSRAPPPAPPSCLRQGGRSAQQEWAKALLPWRQRTSSVENHPKENPHAGPLAGPFLCKGWGWVGNSLHSNKTGAGILTPAAWVLHPLPFPCGFLLPLVCRVMSSFGLGWCVIS